MPSYDWSISFSLMVLTPILVEQGVREELVLLLSLSLSETLSLPPTHVHDMSVSVTPRTFFSFFLPPPFPPSSLLFTHSATPSKPIKTNNNNQ